VKKSGGDGGVGSGGGGGSRGGSDGLWGEARCESGDRGSANYLATIC
jgi:hypothetical protein